MSLDLTSTVTKVRAPDKVRDILDAYEVRQVYIDFRQEGEEWVLGMSDNEEDYALSPIALKPDWLPKKSEFPNEDEWEEALDVLFEEKGNEGFHDLLLDLAPYIEGPLVVLASVGFEGNSWAQAWCVRPGCHEVSEIRTGR